MPHPDGATINEIATMFYRDLRLHHTHDEDELEDMIQTHVHEDVMSIHAHYDVRPLSHRRRDHHELPVVTMREFFQEIFDNYEYGAKLYHTLSWLKVNEQSHTPRKHLAAVAAVVYEGIYVPNDTKIFRTSSITGEPVEVEKRSYHCHLGIHTLRKDAPYEDNDWQLIHSIGGLPAYDYKPKLKPHDFPDNIPAKDDVCVQTEAQMLARIIDEAHDIAFFIDVDADEPLANHFYGWELAGSQHGLDDDDGDDDD